MSKLDNNVVNNIKLLGLDMIKEAGSGDSFTAFNSASIFYNLYMYHLNYNRNNENYINRDRVIVTNSFLASLYSTLHLFGFNISLDELKEYKKFNSNIKVNGIDAIIDSYNVIGAASGFSLGKRYLEEMVKQEVPKSDLISFHTYVICKLSEIVIGSNLEALNYISEYNLNKLHFIILNDLDEKSEKLIDYLDTLDIEVIETNNSINEVDKAIDDAKNSKKLNAIIVTPQKDKDNLVFRGNLPLSEETLNKLRTKYKLEVPFTVENNLYNEIREEIDKRLSKKLIKWEETRKNLISNSKIKEIVEFLETKRIDININVDNIKINDNYNEELIKGNNKILNLVASKSPFILSLSSDFNTTLCNINKSGIMAKDNRLERNILFNNNILTMNGVALGLAYLGFKVFVSLPLVESSLVHKTLKQALLLNIPITYIFTQDSFLNSYQENTSTYELNSLRLIPNLLNFRPSDINEIIGTYSIVSSLKKPNTIIVGSEKTGKLIGTNPKYVVAGAYRVKRERGEANGVLISSGTEVSVALKLCEELLPYGIDLRVVTMPSKELFESQSERYKYTLLPHELKTFVLEFSNTSFWRGYATDERYVLGVDKYASVGTKEELLNYYNLDMDSLKTRIIELMKN